MERARITGEVVAVKALSYGALGRRARAAALARAGRGLRLVYLLLALNVLDVLTTHSGLETGAAEANPLVAGLMGGVGETATYVIKLSVVLTAALLIWKLGKPQALRWLNLAMAAVVFSNLVVFYQGIVA